MAVPPLLLAVPGSFGGGADGFELTVLVAAEDVATIAGQTTEEMLVGFALF